MKKFIFTTDVDWIEGSHIGLLDLYDFTARKDLKLTMFITGNFAVNYAEVLQEGIRQGHEIGTHGWMHGMDPSEDFQSCSYDQQKSWILKSTEAVHNATGVMPKGFRAPNLCVSETTFRILEEENYLFDSSVPSRRYDLGIGQVKGGKYFNAPLDAYYPSLDNLALKGESNIKEIAPSAFFVPINMSALRVLGLTAIKWAINRVSKRSNVLVFYSHPAEFVHASKMILPPNEPKRYTEGLGMHNFEVLENLVDFIISKGYTPANFEECIVE